MWTSCFFDFPEQDFNYHIEKLTRKIMLLIDLSTTQRPTLSRLGVRNMAWWKWSASNSILVRWTLDFEMDSQCAVLEPGLSDPNQLIAERFHVNSLEAP